MQRFIERWRPFLFSITFIVIFHSLIMPAYFVNILKNLPNIISSTCTIASVMFGFVGVMIGVIASINNTSFINVLKKLNTYNLLKEYILICFYTCIITLFFSIGLLFILPENIFDIPWWQVDTLAFLIIFMISTSARLIDMLLAIVGINNFKKDDNNLWKEEPYSPNKI